MCNRQVAREVSANWSFRYFYKWCSTGQKKFETTGWGHASHKL